MFPIQTHNITAVVFSCTPLHRSALSSAQAPFSALCQTNTKIIIICTLSPISAHTSNFPHLIQARTPRTSVRYNWRRRGPAETSIKGSWLSKVPLCVSEERSKCRALIRASCGVFPASCSLRVASLSLSVSAHAAAQVCARCRTSQLQLLPAHINI